MYKTETRIYIMDTPFLSLKEGIQWLKDENILLPHTDDGYYYLPGELGKKMGRYLLSKGWKFEVIDIHVHVSHPEGPWDTLGVPANATKAAIKTAYRKLAMKYHPDRGGDEEKMQLINAAYHAMI